MTLNEKLASKYLETSSLVQQFSLNQGGIQIFLGIQRKISYLYQSYKKHEPLKDI